MAATLPKRARRTNGLFGMKYDRDAVKAWAGDSQWRALQADLARFRLSGYTGWGSEGFWALALFRLQKVVNSCRPKSAILILAIAPILRKSPLCFGSSSDSTIRWAFSMI